MFNLTVDTAHTFYVGENGWLVHNAGGSNSLSDKQIGDLLKTIRSGGEVQVSSYEQARQLLNNLTELRPYTENRLMPNPSGRSANGFGQPLGTYRGDLINVNNPTGPVHPGIANEIHANNPHYNIKLPDGNKAYIVIKGC